MDCKQLPGPVVHPWTCSDDTTHELAQFDPTCDDPPPTPTPGCVGPDELYLPYGWPCCPGLTPIDGYCSSPGPTPDPCASVSPPTCPAGQIPVPVPSPWCYQCLPNPFANPFASPSPSPSSTPLPIGWFCFANAHCQSGYCALPPATPSYRCATPTPTPTPTPTHGHAGCSEWEWDTCMQAGGAGCHDGNCYTPILIDPLGDGFSLSSAGNGVVFNLIPGLPVKIAWTTPDSDDAWLVLDRNGNGSIDSGHELFGNSTSQPQPPPGVEKNGFLALAEYDKAVKGGNGDREIDQDDTVFSLLRLWQDTDHNGISEPEELHLLTQFGLESIALDYRDGRRRDQHGNVFRYRAKAYGPKHNDLGRWAYDVLLRMEPLRFTDAENRYAGSYTDGGNNILRLLGIHFGYDLTTRSWLRRQKNP